jgi:uncharacterized membrane protein required for colicin V production
MSIIFSIVLIAIVAIFAVLGAKKGFFKSVSGLISPLLALIITVLFYKPIAAWIKTWSFIAKMITPNVALPDLSGAEDLMGKLQILMKYLIVNEDTIDETAKAVASNVMAEVLSIAIAFIGLFVVSLIAIKLIFKVLDIFAQAPVIKQANGFLGGVVCACEGFIWCWTFCLAFGSFIFPRLNVMFPEIFTPDMLESVVYKICTEFNPVGFILWIAQFITG